MPATFRFKLDRKAIALFKPGERNRMVAAALADAVDRFRREDIPKRFTWEQVGAAPFNYTDHDRKKRAQWYQRRYGGSLPAVGSNRATSGQTRARVLSLSYVVAIAGSNPRAVLRYNAPPYVNFNAKVRRLFKLLTWDELRRIRANAQATLNALAQAGEVTRLNPQGGPAKMALTNAGRQTVEAWTVKTRRQELAARARAVPFLRDRLARFSRATGTYA